MKLFYRLFYSQIINVIYRNLLYPFRSILPLSMRIPVTGVLTFKDPNSNLSLAFYSNESCPMTRILYWEEKGFTFEFSNIFMALIKNSETFIDIGANVGYYSLLGSKLNPELKVFSFEPSIGPLYFLKKNVALNKFENISVIDEAVGKEEGVISFFEERNIKYSYLKYHASGIGNTINSWGIDNFAKYDVKLTSLDSFLDKNKCTSVDVIKMDTEGTENQILEGAKNTITQHQPIIICEVLFGKIEIEMDKLIQAHDNYEIYQFMSHKKTLKLVDSMAGSTNASNENTNFFFVPIAKRHLIDEFIIAQ